MTRPTEQTKARAQANARIAALVHGFDNHIDAIVAKHKPSNVTCTRGCAGCCRQLVVISGYEATHIVHAKRDVVRAALPVLREQAARLDAVAPDLPERVWEQRTAREAVAKSWWKESTRCAFLTANNECGIYDARPFVCRIWFSVSDPVHCFSENADEAHAGWSPGMIPDCASSVLLRRHRYAVGPLQKMVLNAWEKRA